jgi:diguanylate cyclase (GGDEF)-like protein/PAS domain S-box-containing protein
VVKGEVMSHMEKQDILDEYVRYKYVIENIKDVIWEVDTGMVFTFISQAVSGMIGYGVEQMIGRCILDFVTDESRKYLQEQFKANYSRRINDHFTCSVLYDVEMICMDGARIWCEVCVKPIFRENALTGYVGTTRDISEKKMYENKMKELLEEQRKINEQLEEMVTFDMLTGAYNRRKYEYLISQEIEKAARYGSRFSIIMFDIDNFKEINDLNGHKKGDLVLQDVTALVKNKLRSTDKLFRWGGDEFVILLPEINQKNAFKVAAKIRKTIQSYKFDIEGRKVSLSLGVGDYNPHETPDQLVNRIDNVIIDCSFNKFLIKSTK